jgi:Protein of unknown function (DUF3108)
MGWRATAGVVVVALAVGAAGAFYWVHAHGEAPARAKGEGAPIVAAPDREAPPDREASKSAVALADERLAPPLDPKKAAAAVDAGFPLRSGEVLEFTANVAKLSNVASLTLQVAERRTFLGKNAWHLQAFAHTQNPFRMVFVLDDKFDSYSDASNLASLQYEMHLDERGQKVESVQQMTSTGKEPAPPNAGRTRVLPGTRDPLGMMQYLRNVDWTKTPEVRGPVYDGHKLYEVRARLTGTSAAVEVPAGKFTASTIDLQVFDDGVESKDAHFTLYLANNAARTPVLLEAVLPIATARVELVKSK